jgi:hypothetical protein
MSTPAINIYYDFITSYKENEASIVIQNNPRWGNITVRSHEGDTRYLINVQNIEDINTVSNWEGLESTYVFVCPSGMIPIDILTLLITNLPNLVKIISGGFSCNGSQVGELENLLSKIKYLKIKEIDRTDVIDKKEVYTLTLPNVEYFVCYGKPHIIPTLNFINCKLFNFAISKIGRTTEINIVPNGKNTCLISSGDNCIFRGFQYIESLKVSMEVVNNLMLNDPEIHIMRKMFPDGLDKLRNVHITISNDDRKINYVCGYIASRLPKLSDIKIDIIEIGTEFGIMDSYTLCKSNVEGQPKTMEEYSFLKEIKPNEWYTKLIDKHQKRINLMVETRRIAIYRIGYALSVVNISGGNKFSGRVNHIINKFLY